MDSQAWSDFEQTAASRDTADASVLPAASAEAFPPQGTSCTSVYAKKPDRPDGQMFGVLVCTDKNGREVILKAFSGQFNSVWNIKGWAPPLLSEREFAELTEKTDKEIHELSSQIESLEKQPSSVENDEKLRMLKEKRHAASKSSMQEIFALYKVPVLAALETAESYSWTNPKNGKQYPRYKLRPVFEYKSIFSFYGDGIYSDLAGRREEKDPGKSQPSRTAKEQDMAGSMTTGKMPPTGAGECCAPKLIALAYKLGLRPLSLAEFYYGQESISGGKKHKAFYEPCDEKCGPLLPKMLGLKVLYQDQDIVVVEKPSGLLSVPGRGADKQDCVVNRIKFLFGGDIGWCDSQEKAAEKSTGARDSLPRPHCIQQPSVHRLDMETSGILVLALTQEAHRNLSMQFEQGRVNKRYEAVLDGIPLCIKGGTTRGRLELPFRLDIENRPRQIYDESCGKIGITEWEFLRYEKGGRVRISFTPLTGRTHQLRLHSADEHGLGIPIVGDSLYGRGSFSPAVKDKNRTSSLLLHACMLEFDHPVTGKRMKFTNPPPF